MRVISGSAKGTRLFAPAQARLRPTSGRTRQVLFDTLFHLHPEPKYVLDVFAGTGSLGIEMLSRGAERAWFVEISRRNADIIIRNLKKTHLDPYAKVIVTDAFLFLSRDPPQVFDVILADPPYQKNYSDRFLQSLTEREWLSRTGICVLEMSRRGVPAIPQAFRVVAKKRCGDTILYFLTQN